MTLDEAIKHCEEKAEKQRNKAHIYEDMMVFDQTINHYSEAEYYEELMNECIECAEEYHQFAKWLKELKAYREELPKEIKNAKVRQANALEANVKNENYNSHLAEYIKGYLCGLSYTEGIIAKIIEEVNADE